MAEERSAICGVRQAAGLLLLGSSGLLFGLCVAYCCLVVADCCLGSVWLIAAW